MIADELRRPLEYVWRAQRRGFLREGLNAGMCDLVTAVPSGLDMIRETRPYYRSTYVFVSRAGEAAVSSFDDPNLKVRKVGVQMIGDDGMNSPPAHALAARGIIDTVRGFLVYGDYRRPDPAADIVRAVADREIDVAAVWGPVAGYFARRQSPPLVITPLWTLGTARIPMVFDITMGVRLAGRRPGAGGPGGGRPSQASNRSDASAMGRRSSRTKARNSPPDARGCRRSVCRRISGGLSLPRRVQDNYAGVWILAAGWNRTYRGSFAPGESIRPNLASTPKINPAHSRASEPSTTVWRAPWRSPSTAPPFAMARRSLPNTPPTARISLRRSHGPTLPPGRAASP